MKQPKAPTRDQKEIISRNGLNWKEYSIIEEWETKLILYHKPTGSRKAISKKKGKGYEGKCYCSHSRLSMFRSADRIGLFILH